MKVALLSDCYLPRLGGIEVQVHDLAAHLRARGHEVEIFTATPGPRGERHGFVECVDGVRVHRMALRLPYELPVNPLAPPEVRRRLEAGGFDVAHVHMGVVSPFATDMANLTLRMGLPTAITWHCLMERSQPVFRLLGHARRWADQGAAVSAVSGVAALSVSGVVPGADIRVFPNGIDPQVWEPAEPHLPSADGPVRIVAALRLAARKRPMAVLEIAARARAIVPAHVPMDVTVLGEGPERRRMERYIHRHGMESWAHLPGRAGREELRRRLWESDIYLNPARLEAFGIAALEARTAGLPVLARADTGVGDFVVDGTEGLLGADDEALAEGLARLVLDPGLRAAMARHNATVPPPAAWSAVVALAEAEYRRAGARG